MARRQSRRAGAAALLVAFLLCTPTLLAETDEAEVLGAWRRLLDTPARALAGHDLSWIQEPGAPKDAPLEETIASCASQTFLVSPGPIDRAHLSYVGYRLPARTGPYDQVHRVPPALARPFHIYHYREHTLLTASDGRREQLVVYSVARALELLRVRRPSLYANLFLGPRSPEAQLARIRAQDPQKPVRFLNLTRGFAFVVDGGFPAIAKSSYTLGTSQARTVQLGDERLQAVNVFENVATVYLNLASIQGGGSRNLYGSPDLTENFLRYLRDGLVETLVHEALHCLLRRDKNVRPLFWAISESVRRLGGEQLGKACEEAFVANVASRLFADRPGLSPTVSAYYQRLVHTQHRARVGLLEGRETDTGVALRALLARHAPDPAAPYEDLFWFPLGD